MSNPSRLIDAQRIETSIMMLKQYLGEGDIATLIEVLESIAADPGNEALLDELTEVFDGLGLLQGAVLNYAPYLAIVLSRDLFDNTD
jgi:hypothetical protein